MARRSRSARLDTGADTDRLRDLEIKELDLERHCAPPDAGAFAMPPDLVDERL